MSPDSIRFCRYRNLRIRRSNRQDGAVLFISLAFLLLLTLIGVTAMQTTTMEEKMANNTRQRSIAFQAAETALRDAERLIEQAAASRLGQSGFVSAFEPGCERGLCVGNLTTTELRDLDWTDTGRVQVYGDAYFPSLPATAGAPPAAIEGVGVQPSFVVESKYALTAGNPDAAVYYRSTARGYGGDTYERDEPRSQVTLQSLYLPRNR